MARRTDNLLVITGELVAETPFHVGAAGQAVETDLPIALDGNGRAYVPGTSLAGAIRAHVERAMATGAGARAEGDADPGQGPSRRIFGHGPRAGEAARAEQALKETKSDAEQKRLSAELKKAQGVGSYVVVRDAYLIGEAAAEIRDHVGIGRDAGAAAPGIKFDRQILPKGTRLGFHMEVELAASDAMQPSGTAPEEPYRRDPETDRKWIAAAVHALCQGNIRFGGARTRGLGRLRLVGAEIVEYRTKDAGGILDLALGRIRISRPRPAQAPAAMSRQAATELASRIAPGFTIAPPPSLRIVIDWEPSGPVMVKSGTDGLGVDMLPLVSGTGGGDLGMVLPGSAIKGRLRAHAEMIAMTLGLAPPSADGAREGCPQGGPSGDQAAFQAQIERSPLIQVLFGVAGPVGAAGATPDPRKQRLGLGAVFVDDCFAMNRRLKDEAWRAIVSAPKDRHDGMKLVIDALEKAGWATAGDAGGSADPAAHVAIDRWTGGAADGFLFSALEPRGVGWEPIVIEIALDRLRAPMAAADDPLWRDAAVALLLLAIRDLALGRLPLGFGGNRGYGAVKVRGIAFDANGPCDVAIEALKDWSLMAPAEALSGEAELTAWWAAALANQGRVAALDDAWKRFLTAAPNLMGD